MSASQIFAGLALIVGLAVACRIIAAGLRIPAIILLLPAGFAAGASTAVVNPDKIFGAAFPPLVSLAVAIILYDGGLDLVSKELEGDSRRVVRRLRNWGIPMTWAGAGFFGPAARPVIEGGHHAGRDPDRVGPHRGDPHPAQRPAG
jgi:NhaP-type Na+/H+ or K+/H+ antiporter